MATNRTYELKAKFTAELDRSVKDSFRGMHTRLNNLEKKIKKVNGDNVTVEFDERGADDLEKRIAKIEAALSKVDRTKATPSVEMKKGDETRFTKTLSRLEKRLASFERRPTQAEIDVDPKQANRTISSVKRELNAIADNAYTASIRADADGFPEVSAQLLKLKQQADKINGQKVHLNVTADNIVVSRFGAALSDLVTRFTSVEQAMSNFSRRAYFFQQAAQVAMFGLVGLAAAASGPLLSGLTILGVTLGATAGGFGLLAAAAQPIVSHFTNASQNATKLKSAQDSLKSSTDQLKNAQQSLADAQAAVDEAARTGQEGITNAIKAHQDAVRAVTEAERSARENVISAIEAQKSALDSLDDAEEAHADAQEDAADATRAVADATEDYNDALATEQMRLQSMRLDIEGMAISQQQLALEIREAEKELANAKTPAERREAELRLQELQLQRKQNTLEMAAAERELNEAQKNGTEELQSATEARKSALESQADANEGVKDSLEEVRAAERGVVQAQKDVDRARREGQRQVREAMRSEREAQAAIQKARDDAARQMSDAMKQVARAQEDVAAAAKQVKEDQGAVNALLNSTAGYLQPLIEAVNNFKTQYKESFAGANQATADLGTQIVTAATNQLPMLGIAAQNVAMRLSGVFSRLQQEFTKFGALKSFRTILANIPGITAKITSAIGRFGAGFLNIMAQAMPYVRQFSSWLNRISLAFLKWTNSQKGRRELEKFFKSAAPVAKTLWQWISKIAGTILRWSIQHPKELAAVFNMIGQLLMFIVKASIWVMNQLFKIAQAEHPWMRLAVTILGVRAALFAVGFLFGWLRVFALRQLGMLMGWIGRIFLSGWKSFTGALRLLWMGVMGRIPLMAGVAIKGILFAFSRLLIIGFIFQFIVNAVGAAWNEITNHTFGTIQGLIQMWRDGSLNIGQVILNIFRQVFASLIQIVGEAFIKIVSQGFGLLQSLLNLFPGNVGDRIFGGLDAATKDLINDFRESTQFIRGSTNQAAEKANDNFQKMEKGTTGSTDKIKTKTKQDMGSMQSYITKMTGKGSKEGQGNLKDFYKGGSGSLKDLNIKGSGSMKNLMGNSNQFTGDMKIKGLGNFKDFNIGGQGETEKLKTGASTKASLMEANVTAANVKMKEKGITAITNLQEDGNAMMGVLQQEWVDKAWKTSTQTQESFNAILEGMARFIEKSGVSGVKKPEQFSIVGNPNGNMMGGGNEASNRVGGRGSANLRKGGEMRFASGGSHGPTGGIAQGTTRVYGEVPGTTEFYITDNPRYRDRNMEILRGANQHMMNSQGNTLKFAAGGVLPPKESFHNRNSDGTLGYSADSSVAARAAAGAAMWRGLVVQGNGNVTVNLGDPGPGAIARAYSDGRIVMGPNSKHIAAAHEFGHQLGLGHGGDSIMGGAGMVTPNDFAALSQYYGVKAPGAGTTPTGGDTSTSNTTITQTGPGPQRATEVQGGSGGGVGGLFGGRKGNRRERNPDRKAGGFMGGFMGGMFGGRRRKKNRGRRHATGGVLETLGKYSTREQLNAAAGAAEAGSDRRLAKGVIWNSGAGEGQYGATNNSLWDAATAQKAKDIIERFPVAVNTYENHPPGYPELAQSSIDAWDISGRGNAIGYPNPHNEVYDYMKNMDPANWKWTLGEGDAGHSGSYRHVHTSWAPQGEVGSGGMSGNTGMSGGATVDYDKMYDKYVPKMSTGLNYGKVGEAMMARGNEIRGKHKSQMLEKTGSGGTAPKWDGSGNLDEWLKQGIIYANSGIEASDSNISSLHGRAMQESGGDPTAVNNWDSNAAAGTPSKGLLQVIEPTWNAWMNEFGKSTGAFDQNWSNPIMNTATAVRYMKGEYGGIVGSNGQGYAGGGIARKPHVGLVGEGGGNELMWPLGSKKATRAVTAAFEKSKSASTQTDPGGASINSLTSPTSLDSGSATVDMGDTNAKLDELKQAIIDTQLDARQLKETLLAAIWAGLESDKGGEKMDTNLGRRWEKNARTKGEM